MKIIETGPGDIGFVLWGHCQNLLDDPRKCKYMSVLLSNTLFLYSGSEFCVAHAQSKFVKVVLYHKIISSSTLTSVGSFMLVSGKAQSWLLAAWLVV